MLKIATAIVIGAICYLAFYLLPEGTRHSLELNLERSVGIQVQHFRASR